MGTANGSDGGAAQLEQGAAAEEESAVSRANARVHGSTRREKALRKMRSINERLGRLYMLAQNLVKTVSGRGFRAMHGFGLSQVSKTHRTPVAVINLVTAHGFCMAESMRYRCE